MSAWRWLIGRPSADAELAREIEAHIAERVDDLIDEGASEADAKARARREFGNKTLQIERSREVWIAPWLSGVWQDLRYAARSMVHQPGFAVSVIGILALGIGAGTAVFSVVNTVLLEPLPYDDAGRLVRIVQRAAPANPSAPLLRRSDMSQTELSQWRTSTKTLSAMTITITPPITLMPTASGSARLTGSLMSANTFAMLGARAQLGRTFEPADAAAGSNVVVISARAWERYFQSDPNILGRTIRLQTQGPESGLLDGAPLTIVGVMSASFDFPQPNSDFWAPITEDSPSRARLGGAMVARLAEGVTMDAATDEANAIGESLRPRPTSGRSRGRCQTGCGASRWKA